MATLQTTGATENVEALDPGYASDHIVALGSEMPAFLSDHLSELTGHDGEGTCPLGLPSRGLSEGRELST